MKKNYFKVLCAAVLFAVTSFTTVNAQYIEVYQTDFSTIAEGTEINNFTPSGTWIGSNQTGGLWAKSGTGMAMCNWRGANLIGHPIENWAPGKNVRFEIDLKTTGTISGSDQWRKTLFGLTKRVVSTVDKDANSYNTDFSIGIEVQNTTADKISFSLLNDAGQIFTTDAFNVSGDEAKVVFTAQKSTTSNEFIITATIEDGEVVLSTLSSTITQSEVYGATDQELVFTAYCLGPYPVLWNAVNIEMEEAGVVLPTANAGVNQEVIGNGVVTLDGSSNYDSDPSIVYKWVAPEGIVLSATNVSNPTFTAPNVSRVTKYSLALTATVTLEGSPIESAPSDVEITVTPAAGKYASGDGTNGNPYILTTADHLYSLTISPEDFGKEFQLGGPIDLSSENEPLMPIGGDDGFTGVFDGNMNLITGLKVIQADGYTGMFSKLTGQGKIMNLGLIEAEIENTGTGATGAFVGYISDANTQLSKCFTLGGFVKSKGNAGGLIGHCGNWSEESIYTVDCFAYNTIASRWGNAGIIGGWHNGSTFKININNSAFYGVANVLNEQSNEYLGLGYGIHGAGTDDTKIGFMNNFYIEGSGIANSVAKDETELSESAAAIEGSYAGFDFTNTWEISEVYDFAVLKGFTLPMVKTLADRVENAKNELDLGDLSGLVSDITLPLLFNEASVSWSVDNVAISETGVVTRPTGGEANAQVKLTATISLGNESVTKVFDATVLAEGATDIDKSLDVSLNIYPNPVVNILNITDVDDGTVITVYNATGSVVSVTKAAGGLTQIDLSSQPTGVYLVKVSNKVERVLKK